MASTACRILPVRRLQAERLTSPRALREAQALRFRVFGAEFGASFADMNPSAATGLDVDAFDPHCQHLGVRDLTSGALVATTRLLDRRSAARLGRFYSEGEFALQGFPNLEGPVLEIGRTCVDAAYRNGGTIAVLWSEISDVLNEGQYQYLMGCASISMKDGGIQAEAIMRRLRPAHLCNRYLTAVPRTPLPALQLPGHVTAQLPPLLKAYIRLGAKICGEPCWDREFQTADVFVLLKRDNLCPRYARHFKTAV